MTVSRRISRRRLRLLLGSLRAPRPVWRSLVIMPLILVLSLLGMRESAAWFTNATSASGGMVTSGSFGTLMTVQGLNPLGDISFEGPYASNFSRVITVTSNAAVPLPITAILSSGGPSITQSATTIKPSAPGNKVTFTLSGTYSTSWSGTLEIVIGSNAFDSTTLPVTVDPQRLDVASTIKVDEYGPSFSSCTGFNNLALMKVSRKTGSPSVQVGVSLSQTNNPPQPGHSLAVTLHSPIGGTFTTSSSGQLITVDQPYTEVGNPTNVTVTLTGLAPGAIGFKTYTFTLKKPSSCLPPPPPPCPHGDSTPDLSPLTFGGSKPCDDATPGGPLEPTLTTDDVGLPQTAPVDEKAPGPAEGNP